jgi:hypothetical protein
MPHLVAPGVYFWTRPEVGLPPSRASHINDGQLRTLAAHYSTGRTLGSRDLGAWVRNIYSYHVNTRGYDDLAYNAFFAFDRNDWNIGHVFEGRWDGRVGAHTAGWNSRVWAACFLGDDDPNFVDLQPGAHRAWAWIAGRRADRTGRISYHRQLNPGSTACPGNEIAHAIDTGTLGGAVVPPAPAPVDWNGVRAITATLAENDRRRGQEATV